METSKLTLEQLSSEIEKREKTIWELADKVYNKNPVAIQITKQAETELEELRAEKKKRCKGMFSGVVKRLQEQGYIPEDKK